MSKIEEMLRQAGYSDRAIEYYIKKVNVGKMYMWYTTCPGCAKKYGKNYVVIISEVK